LSISNSRPLHVFLCHSSGDKLTVREIYRRLNAEDWIDPWLDEEKLYPGHDWNFEIEEAVEAADIIIVFLTKNSVNKEGYLQRELRFVLDLGDEKPEGTLYIIPIRLEECKPPRRLRRWQYTDYFPPSEKDRSFDRLLVSLRNRAVQLGIAVDTNKSILVSKKSKDETNSQLHKPFIQATDDARVRPSYEVGFKHESSQPSIEKANRLKTILNIAEQILETANISLMENEKALLPLFQDASQVKTVYNKMMDLYHNQRNRGDFGRWKSFLEEAHSKETRPGLKEIIGSLISDIDKLYGAFYSKRPYSSYDPSKITMVDKLSMAMALEGKTNKLDGQEIIQIAESYLDYLRDRVENIGRSVGMLRTQVE
jgi:hypothetical protein